MNNPIKEKTLEKALFGQSLNDVHQVVMMENDETIQSLKHHPHNISYSDAVMNPPTVQYGTIRFKPKGEILYRGESFTKIEVNPVTRNFEITNGEQKVIHGDLFAFKGLHIDDAFGFALSEAVKRVFKGKQIYDIRLTFMFQVCYTLEINKNRMYVGVTLADEHPLNDELSMDEKMLIELACNLTYGYFAKINALPNPLTEAEILEKQQEYAALNQNFIDNESDVAKSGQWDKVRQYEVVTRDTETGEILDTVQSLPNKLKN